MIGFFRPMRLDVGDDLARRPGSLRSRGLSTSIAVDRQSIRTSPTDSWARHAAPQPALRSAIAVQVVQRVEAVALELDRVLLGQADA